MPAIKYTSAVEPVVDLPFKNWTDRARALPTLTSWWTLHSGRWTEEDAAGVQRITGCAARAGEHALTKTAASLGPRPATVGGVSCADFTNGEINGLFLDQAVQRDNITVVAILGLGSAAPAQNRDILGLYGNGDAIRLWRNPSTGWSWRAGSSDAAVINRPWAEGPLMIVAQWIGTAVSLRLRDRAGTSTIATGTLTSSVPTSVRAVFGQDEISDGHAQAAPNTSRTWSEYWYEAAIHAGPVLTDPAALAFWDDYFTTVYGAA